jgi:hypothetical protein
MEWLASFGAFSRDRQSQMASPVLVYWTGARVQLGNRLTAISDVDVRPAVTDLDICKSMSATDPLPAFGFPWSGPAARQFRAAGNQANVPLRSLTRKQH